MNNDKFMELVNLKKENIKLLEDISDKLDKVAHETYETYQQAQKMKSLGESIETCLKKNDKRTCELLDIEYSDKPVKKNEPAGL
uniref:Uncharacterized protein n=1 Tax=Strongyloides papillosus TaxID=174720 RepID=A0A0N5BK11_STREA